MSKKIFLMVLFQLFYVLHGYCQSVLLNEVEIRSVKQQLDKTSGHLQKIKLLLRLSNLFVVSEQDTPPIKDAVFYDNQAIQLCVQAKDQVHLAEAYLLRSHLAQIQHDYKTGKAFALNAIKLFHEQRNFNQEGEAYVLLWSNNALNGMSYEERIPLLSKAADCFHSVGNKCREADCLREMGDLYHIRGEFGKALHELKTSMLLAKDIHCPHLQGTYDLLGVCYLMLGDNKSAIQCGLMAVKIAEDAGEDSTLALCTYYNRLGISYIKSNDWVSGKKCIEKSRAIALKCKDPNSIAELTFTNASMLLEDGKPTQALDLVKRTLDKYPEIEKRYDVQLACFMVSTYKTMKLYDKAIPFAALIAQFIERNAANRNQLALGYNHLIPFYIATGDLKKAAFYVDRFRVFCQKADVPIFNGNYHFLQFQVDSAEGNYIAAIQNYEQYNNIKDSLLNETKSMQINQLGILFEIEKKDKNIQVLTSTSELQQSNLKQATLMRNIYFGGSILLLVILLLLLYSFLTKQRTNKILRTQQEIINSKNDSLQHLLTEKEWLIKEIHHRVKNNLHMVAGLLSSQTEFLQGEEALLAITDSQHRIQAMSLIHQKLYQSESLSYTEMPSYIFDLTAYIKDAYGKNVTIQLEIAKVEFTLAYSIPIGLILNEAVTNAMKYAFPDGRKGIIKIILQELDNTDYRLSVEDNGVGLPADFDLDKCLSLGLSLMRGLSTDINGTFSIGSNTGTKIEIYFSNGSI